MFEKFNMEFGEDSNAMFNSADAGKFTADLHNPLSSSNDPIAQFFAPVPPTGSAIGHPCIFMQKVKEIKADYQVEEDESEIIPGAKALSPSFLGNLIPSTMSSEMRLQLLQQWDRCDAATLMVMAAMRGYSTMKLFRIKAPNEVLDKRMLTFYSTAKRLRAEVIKGNGGNGPTEQELVDAYEMWQYEQRKALGEPVHFRNGRLCFEKFIFENGLQPGPFPGLGFYSSHGRLVDSKMLAQWLADTKAERKKRQNECVGFFECPDGLIRAADMVWFFGDRYDVHGPESYGTLLKLNGGNTSMLFSITAMLLWAQRESGEPLPCTVQV